MAKPVIGVNCDLEIPDAGKPRLWVYTNYFDAVAQAGGLPMLVPFLDDDADIQQALASVDALLLTGGGDLDPSSYGAAMHPTTKLTPKRRQEFDLALTRAALACGMPILGICMGMQMLNVAAGGTLLQGLESRREDSVKHRQMENDEAEVHEVSVSPGSHLARIVGDGSLGVNSTHHHAVDAVAPGFSVCARAADGIIEAIERPGMPPVLGVQWHPERLIHLPRHKSLFETLVRQARSH